MKTYIEVPLWKWRAVMQAISTSGTIYTIEENGNQDIYRDAKGVVVLRIYKHKKSEQCLVHHSIAHHIPKDATFHGSREGSIYGA